jgi:hypothetical protein
MSFLGNKEAIEAGDSVILYLVRPPCCSFSLLPGAVGVHALPRLMGLVGLWAGRDGSCGHCRDQRQARAQQVWPVSAQQHDWHGVRLAGSQLLLEMVGWGVHP